MSLKNRNKVNPSFNMSSLADIIFLLLIFFLITSRIVSPNALPVKRPTSTITNTPTKVVARITVNDRQQYFVDGNEVAFPQLASTLQSKIAEEEKPVVILDMDKSLSIDKLVEMYDIANDLQFEMVLATEPKSKR